MIKQNDQPGAEQELRAIQSCGFCGSTNGSLAFSEVEDYFFGSDPGQFSISRCADCASLWLNEQPIGERLVEAYHNYYTHKIAPEARSEPLLKVMLRNGYIREKYGGDNRLATRMLSALYRKLSPNRLHTDAHYRFAPRSPAHLLDHGCGSGAYLTMMQANGYSVVGTEFDETALAKLRQRGIPALHVSDPATENWHAAFDHITISHVLEHVPDPVALLQQLGNWLKPGGTLYIELPSADARGLSIFGKYWRGLEVPRHFFIPSKNGLLKALGECGFTLERQILRESGMSYVWEESLQVVPESHRDIIARKMSSAPLKTVENGEFLTVLCRKAVR